MERAGRQAYGFEWMNFGWVRMLHYLGWCEVEGWQHVVVELVHSFVVGVVVVDDVFVFVRMFL